MPADPLDRDMTTKKPLPAKILVALLVVLGIGGLMGAYGFLSDPSGTGMGLSTDLLTGFPVSDFLLVGLFLGGVYCVSSFVIAAGLLTLKGDRWLGVLSLGTRRHWSWTMSVALGTVLVGWTTFEYVALIGPAKMPGLYGPDAWVGLTVWGTFLLLGIGILALVLLPSVRRYAVPTTRASS